MRAGPFSDAASAWEPTSMSIEMWSRIHMQESCRCPADVQRSAGQGISVRYGLFYPSRLLALSQSAGWHSSAGVSAKNRQLRALSACVCGWRLADRENSMHRAEIITDWKLGLHG